MLLLNGLGGASLLRNGVSLIVTTYNWPRALDLTLASVAQQSVLPTEIIIADDGSRSDTADVVMRWRAILSCPLIHVWQEDRGYRLARSRNRALLAARGSYIVLVDGDMVLHRRFIEDHVSCARPDCFIQGARPRLSPSATAKLLRTGIPDISLLSPDMEHRAYALRSRLLSRWTSKARRSLGGIQGCNQSFWREHVTRVNGYDERFTAWGPEDRELAARLLHIGVLRNYVRHRAIAYHLFHPTRAPHDYNPFERLLSETMLTRAVWCKNGMSTHSSSQIATSESRGDATISKAKR